MDKFGVIVVGAGHAGVEAALASARMGVRTLLLTMSADQIATMSCNPAIGGLGKSQIAKEIDALGGAMARVADESAMQYRVLNERKGPAVRATRVHVDRHEYRSRMKFLVESQANLELRQGQVKELVFEGSKLSGIRTAIGENFYSEAVVLTTGTFMNGKAHVGLQNFSSGRAGEPSSVGLSDFLRSIGLKLGRFKTGTVPRVDSRSIDYSLTETQNSLTDCAPLSIFSEKLRADLEPAHLAFTNEATHEIIRANLDKSPLYSGIIESTGPRYCPSLEDKVVRFSDKSRHQIFLEKEGRWTNEVYVGGLSTSLPVKVQEEFLHSIPALRSARIIRPGYAIEYDYLDSTQLSRSLQVKDVPGLYFAGQVNGTSGYEEAAAQGLIAGINAAAAVLEQPEFILSRSDAYIGVMIDDLTTKGTSEPYRMLSSRAEWRLVLREDNVDVRMSQKAIGYKLLSDVQLERLSSRLKNKAALRERLKAFEIYPQGPHAELLRTWKMAVPKNKISGEDFLKRPDFQPIYRQTLFMDFFSEFTEEEWRSVCADIKYEGYLKQSASQIRQVERLESLKIPDGFSYRELKGLPYEAIEKFERIRPASLGQAARISGVTPASVSVLGIYLSKLTGSTNLRERPNDACAST